MLFHGTCLINFNNIVSNGFDIDCSSDGRWGCGIYFTNNIEEAKVWGECIIKVELSEDPLMLKYCEIASVFPYLSVSDEEGTRELKEYVISKGYNSVMIVYDDGGREVVVYNTDLIQIQLENRV